MHNNDNTILYNATLSSKSANFTLPVIKRVIHVSHQLNKKHIAKAIPDIISVFKGHEWPLLPLFNYKTIRNADFLNVCLSSL